MLDLQRQKSSYQQKESVFFTRGVLIAHFVIGAAVATALVFQEVFMLALSAGAWYAVSALLVTGMACHRQWCRLLLGAWFLLGAAGCLAHLIWFMPTPATDPTPEQLPPLSVRIMPLWLSTVALLYGFGGVIVFISRRVRRATTRGFTLWEVPNFG